jgi:hypothetical protein
MLLKSKSSHTFGIGYDPRIRFGSRTIPRPKVVAQAASTYSGIYCRPNIDNGGTIPASGTLCTCPDIWISGTQPLANFQTALATDSSYATASGDGIQQGQPNYIYVRARNGASQPLSTQVQLFALPCGVIQWPAKWGQYSIPTDIEYQPPNPPVYISNINNLAAAATGVAQNAFIWSDPETPPPGSDHYCLITWMNNASNPFPNTFGQLDISNLILNDLGYGWRNVSLQSGSSPTVQMVTQLDIPVNTPAGSRQYYIIVIPSGFPNGWQVSMSCSQTDAKGNAIAIPQQNLPTQQGLFLGVYAWLDPGFSATLTFNLYQNGAGPANNASLQVQAQYQSAPHELKRALALGVVDFVTSRALQSAFRGFGLGPTAACPLGSDNVTLKRP